MADQDDDTVADTVSRTHDALRERLEGAESSRADSELRGRVRAIEPFLASTSRYAAAANAVLLPAARRHLAHGRVRSHAALRQTRHLELALVHVKAKLYGSSTAVRRRAWGPGWRKVDAELGHLQDLEETLADDVVEAADGPAGVALADDLHRAELRGPTRPRPYLPHDHRAGRVVRVVTGRIDRWWDAAAGREVPDPVMPRRHRGERGP